MVLTAAEHGTPVTFQPAPVTQLAAAAPGPGRRAAAQLRLRRRVRRRRPGRRCGERAQLARSRLASTAPASLATRQIDHVADTFKSVFDDREGEVDHVGGSYRAVFTGFTEAEAKSACSTVAASQIGCAASAR